MILPVIVAVLNGLNIKLIANNKNTNIKKYKSYNNEHGIKPSKEQLKNNINQLKSIIAIALTLSKEGE